MTGFRDFNPNGPLPRWVRDHFTPIFAAQIPVFLPKTGSGDAGKQRAPAPLGCSNLPLEIICSNPPKTSREGPALTESRFNQNGEIRPQNPPAGQRRIPQLASQKRRARPQKNHHVNTTGAVIVGPTLFSLSPDGEMGGINSFPARPGGKIDFFSAFCPRIRGGFGAGRSPGAKGRGTPAAGTVWGQGPAPRPRGFPRGMGRI